MNTKKLIGMIIGVTLFAALIAGATFAYLTYAATVQNATKTVTTRNFTFTSPTGTNITELRVIAGSPARTGFAAGKDYVALALSKAADTPYASSVKIILKKTNGITLANALKFAVCRSATAADCNTSTGSIPTSTNTANWVVINGNITTGNSEQVLFEDTATAIGTSTTGSPFKVTGAASTTYYVYFWIDPSVVTTSNLANIEGKTLKGNLYFTATQGE